MDAAIFAGLMAMPDPTEEELNEDARERYAISGPFDIDRWPESVRALSMPTKMVEVADRKAWVSMWDMPGYSPLVAEYAAKLDDAMNWDTRFVRLNSRSPKDASYPGLPITCAGRQAMWWIMSSERCLDDSVTHWRADAPIFICLRRALPIDPAFEFLCFAKDGEVIAVSRYDYHNPSRIPAEMSPKLLDSAKAFYGRHLSDHYGDVVFDLNALGTAYELLIELNPYGLSDPCCFGSYQEVERGGVRLSLPPTPAPA